MTYFPSRVNMTSPDKRVRREYVILLADNIWSKKWTRYSWWQMWRTTEIWYWKVSWNR